MAWVNSGVDATARAVDVENALRAVIAAFRIEVVNVQKNADDIEEYIKQNIQNRKVNNENFNRLKLEEEQRILQKIHKYQYGCSIMKALSDKY